MPARATNPLATIEDRTRAVLFNQDGDKEEEGGKHEQHQE